jgi:hypothetical protein
MNVDVGSWLRPSAGSDGRAGRVAVVNTAERFRALPANIQRLLIDSVFLTVITCFALLKKEISKRILGGRSEPVEETLVREAKNPYLEILMGLRDTLLS